MWVTSVSIARQRRGLGIRAGFLTRRSQTVYHFPVMPKLKNFAVLTAVSVSLAVLGAVFAPAQGRPTPNSQLASKDINGRVEALLKQMTLEEKIGQTVQYA